MFNVIRIIGLKYFSMHLNDNEFTDSLTLTHVLNRSTRDLPNVGHENLSNAGRDVSLNV